MPATSDPARLALDLAMHGWHILPLSPASKRPLGNCPACRPQHGTPAHQATACPCLAADGWCHGVRAATTDPDHITAWWRREPRRGPRRRRGPLRPGPGRHRRPPRPSSTPPGHRAAARHRPGRRTHPAQRVGRPGPVPRRPRHPHPARPAPRRLQPLARPARNISPSPLRPHRAVYICGIGHPSAASARPSPTPRAGTGWPGKSTSRPAGPTASPPVLPPPSARTSCAPATRPVPAACPSGSLVRSSAPPPHRDHYPGRRPPSPAPAGPARPHI